MKKGLTLIEAMIALGISAAVTTGGLSYYNEQNKADQVDELASNVTKIISAIDQRVYIDKYDSNLWPNVTEYNTTRQVQEFLNRELIARTSNAGCRDSSSGWKPQIPSDSSPEDITYRENLNLVSCNLLGTATTINDTLTANLRIKKGSESLESVSFYLYFENEEDFKEGFLDMKKLLIKSKEMDTKNVTGKHSYNLVDMSKSNPSENPLTNQECLEKGISCGYLAEYNSDGLGTEYLDVYGSNSMINTKVTFKTQQGAEEDFRIKDCFRFEYEASSSSWVRKDDVDCGIGIDQSKGHSFVEADVYSASAKRFQLGSMCSMNINGETKEIPCGMMIEEENSSLIAIGALDEIQATTAFVSLLNVVNIQTGNITVDQFLKVNGITELNELTVNSTSNFNEKVTMEGVNNVIEQNLIVNGNTELDQLFVTSNANFEKDVTILGNLDIQGKDGYVRADHLKLDTMTASELHTPCSLMIDGALKLLKVEKKVDGKKILHTEPVVCTTYTDIDKNMKIAWKLANARVGQILPFDGSCPEGFSHFTESSGRFLIGQNHTQLDGISTEEKNKLVADGDAFVDKNGIIIEYKIGESGGEAYHRLTEDELPIHNHEVPDIKASCSGADCAGYAMATVGARGDTVWSNANEIPTGPAGKDESHENRPPYYVVNYCIYEG